MMDHDIFTRDRSGEVISIRATIVAGVPAKVIKTIEE